MPVRPRLRAPNQLVILKKALYLCCVRPDWHTIGTIASNVVQPDQARRGLITEKHHTPGIQERKNGDGSINYLAPVRVRGFPHLKKTFARKNDAKTGLPQT